MHAKMDSPTVFPEAFARLKADLENAAADWSYLSAIPGDGPVRDLEHALGRHFGAQWVIAVTSGSMALHVALLAAGVGPGDEVIAPAVTWPQVIFAIRHCGATPVLADVGPRMVTVDPMSVANRVSRKTRVILATHLYGFPADMERLQAIAQSAGALLIADAAQGVGTLIRGKPIGSIGDFVALSFGRGKLLTAGEGGALICRTRKLYEKAVRLSQHPLRMHRDIDDPALRGAINPLALNGRLHPLVASLAIGQLQALSRRNFLPVIRDHFDRLVDDIRAAGHGGLLPSLPDCGNPSGVCLPLWGDIGAATRRLQEMAAHWGYRLCEATPPLALCNPRGASTTNLLAEGNPWILATSCGGWNKCPNTHKLFLDLHWELRMDMWMLLEALEASKQGNGSLPQTASSE